MADDSTAARVKAYDDAKDYLAELEDMSDEDRAAAFGDSLNPDAFLYDPVNLTQSQLEGVRGNMRAEDGASALSERVNSSIWENDLNRIRTLMPGYDSYTSSYLGTTAALQAGELPYSDVMDILGENSSLSGALATPGGNRATTLKDLGISRLDAMNQGNSMYTDFVNLMQTVSPQEQQMTPQDSFLTPSERLNADIEQAALTQQGNASAEIARASPDPAENALINAAMGVEFASLGASYTPTTDYSGMIAAQGISAAGDIISKYAASANKSSGTSTTTVVQPTTSAAESEWWATQPVDETDYNYNPYPEDSGSYDIMGTGSSK